MRRPVAVLAAVGALALLVTLVGAVELGRMIRRGFSARDEPSPVEARLARSMRSWATPAELRSRANPLHGTKEILDGARAHFADHCASCHSNDGSGATPIGRSLYPRAPDMRGRDTQGLTDGELFGVIQQGIRLTGMPAWGEPGRDDEETWALVAFIRHLRQLTPQELREMEGMNPRSPQEANEELDEEQFLGGDASQTPPDHSGIRSKQ